MGDRLRYSLFPVGDALLCLIFAEVACSLYDCTCTRKLTSNFLLVLFWNTWPRPAATGKLNGGSERFLVLGRGGIEVRTRFLPNSDWVSCTMA